MESIKTEDAAKQKVADAKAKAEKDRQNKEHAKKQATLTKALSNVRSFSDWKALSAESKMAVISDGKPMPNYPVFTTGDTGIRTWMSLIPIQTLKNPAHLQFAKNMVLFMEQNADLSIPAGDKAIGKITAKIEIILSQAGDILGGMILIQQKVNDLQGTESYGVFGVFDDDGLALSYDEGMQYDH